jgi:hypothetical protein
MFGMKDVIDEDKLVKGIAEVVIPALAVAARAVAREAIREVIREVAGMGVAVTLVVNPKKAGESAPRE